MKVQPRIKIHLIILVAFFFNWSSAQQVINVESLRKITDSSKWSGSISLNLSLVKNTTSIFGISNDFNLQYNNKKSLYLLVSDFNLQRLSGNAFINNGSQHFRYNLKISETIKLEAFLQGQYDEVSEITFRGLVGAGPRFKLSKSDNYRFYLGTLCMYEYEESKTTSQNIYLRDFRGSMYFSFSMYPTPNIAIVGTTYYQPLLDTLKDYRISSETSISFKIIKNLSFLTTFVYMYDAFPVINIPKTQYQLTNGIVYTFD